MDRKDPHNHSNGGRHRKDKSDKTGRKEKPHPWAFLKAPGRDLLRKKQNNSGKERKILPVMIAPPPATMTTNNNNSNKNNFNEIKEMRKKYQNVPKQQTAEEEDKEVFENVEQANPVMPTHLLRPGKMKWKQAEQKKEGNLSPDRKKNEDGQQLNRVEQLERENEELRNKLKNVQSILKTSEMSRETVEPPTKAKLAMEQDSVAKIDTKKRKGDENAEEATNRDQASVTGSKTKEEDGDSVEDGKEAPTIKAKKKKKSAESNDAPKKKPSEIQEEPSKGESIAAAGAKNSETSISSGDSQTSNKRETSISSGDSQTNASFQADRDKMDDALKRLMKEIEKLRKENAELRKLTKRSPDLITPPVVLTDEAYYQSKRVLTIMKKNQVLDTVLDHKSNKTLSTFFRENQKPTPIIYSILDQAITRGLKFMTACSDQIDDIIDNEMRQFICNTYIARKALLQALFKHPEMVPDMWGGGPQLVKMWKERAEKEENEGDSPKKENKKES